MRHAGLERSGSGSVGAFWGRELTVVVARANHSVVGTGGHCGNRSGLGGASADEEDDESDDGKKQERTNDDANDERRVVRGGGRRHDHVGGG